MEVDRHDAMGWTALLCALVRGHWSVASALLNAGARVTIPNSMGLSAIDIANGNRDLLADLIEEADTWKLDMGAIVDSLRGTGLIGSNASMPEDLKKAILAAACSER